MSLGSTSLKPIDIPSNMKIHLTDVENKICTLFDECTTHLKQEKGIETSCRIAGGWVRDKLLGSQSNDIDIALSDMMGVAFAEHLVSFSESKGVKVGSITKIESNPDQSKHLETARFKVFDRELDLVNLRSEEYADSSRIPTHVAFGTPLQDALRRDITINALFYNIHTRAVEDLTEKGLEDLKKGIIRTPLPPKETFRDDPLRVIRCIRFASRFGFTMVPELEEAASDPEILEAITSKISKERISEELSKMMKDRDPVGAIRLINKLSLYPSIFSIPPSPIRIVPSVPPSPSNTSLSAATILNALIQLHPSARLPPIHPTLLSVISTDPFCKARLYLSAALTPYLGVTYLDKKKRKCLIVEAILRDGLKLGTQNHFLDGIPALFSAAEILSDPRLDTNKFKFPSERVAIGLLLREKCIHNPSTGSHWTTSLLFSLLQELVPLYDVEKDDLNVQKATERIELYNKFVTRVEELELPTSLDAKSLLDGREVLKVLNATKSGTWTGAVMAKVREWQLQYPEGTKTKDECAAWLRDEQAAGRIAVGEEGAEPASKKSKMR